MTYFGTSDLPALLADLGVPVVWGSLTGKGIVDVADQELLMQASISFSGRETKVTIATNDFPGIRERSAITIEGVSHMVIYTQRMGDGATTELLCVPQ